MCPTGIPKDLLFFAMLTHTPGYKLNSLTRYTVRWHRKGLHPNIMHTLHTQTEKFITWFFLSLPAWKGSLAIATNHKRGSTVAKLKLFCHYLKKYCNVGTTQMQLMCGWLTLFCAQFTAIIFMPFYNCQATSQQLFLCVCMFVQQVTSYTACMS